MSERIVRDPGSFRDPGGYVFRVGKRVFRALNQSGLDTYRAFRKSKAAEWAENQRFVTRSWELKPDEWRGLSLLPAEVAGVLEQERVPFISYPYEWTFDMLKDAALLQLDLEIGMARNQLTMKDATAYNIQFLDGKPIFIDVLSFQSFREGSPWMGYAQFCRNFFYPLLLQACCGVDFQPLLRSYIDGMPVTTVRRILGLRAWKSFAMIKHVILQAYLQRTFEETMPALTDESQAVGFSLDRNVRLMEAIKNVVTKMSPPCTGSHWSSYGEKNSYSARARENKRAFVSEHLKKIAPTTVWDIGCNTGEYSLLAAGFSKQVVAFDSDTASVNALYTYCKRQSITQVLPLVVDLIDPSPALGWALEERKSILDRGNVDCVLALALIHHLCLMRNIPIGHVFSLFAKLGAQHLLIEFVPKTDQMAKRLLTNREDVYPWYSEETFEREASARFIIEERLELERGGRIMYRLVRRSSTRNDV